MAMHGVSQRRACDVLAVDRSSIRYRSIRPDDAAERTAMKAAAAERRRFGYRRIHIMLDRQGIVMNLKVLRRLCREERLQVRKRGGRKRALGTRRPMAVPQAANERWSLEFASRTFGSSAMPSPMVAGSGFWRSWMISRGSAWRWSPTPRCPVPGSCASSIL